jgi:transcriptional antiterminator Rof (Rho-off)
MTEPYRPISCSVHDRLLALATLRRECTLLIAAPGEPPRLIRGLIVDVYSKGGAEHLRLADGVVIRLDHIRALDGEPIPAGDG